ncbi:MAG: hypothetical protein KatS3mg081_1452 [Gemmatimonadales bacterium]|nr:hypothetical protein HRbin33_00670 [bacterium HR33]GIW52097.1 MAG: hypothetical protein KatS3mg081_1452 [Gemmatimonadales bacterium]
MKSERHITTLDGMLSPAFAVYDRGQLIGTVVAPEGRLEFGASAPTLLLNRAGQQAPNR